MLPQAVIARSVLASAKSPSLKNIKSKLKKSVPKGQTVEQFLKDHMHKPVHISDVLGKDYLKKAEKILKVLEKKEQSGGKKKKKLIRGKLRKWLTGATKFKPSDLFEVFEVVTDIGKTVAGVTGIKPAVAMFDVGKRLSKFGKTKAKDVEKAYAEARKKKAAKGSGAGKAGSGLKLTGQGLPYGVTMTGRGKIKRDRYSVFHGYHPKTRSGLTKDAFILRGKKVISKRKSEIGQRMVKEGRGIHAK